MGMASRVLFVRFPPALWRVQPEWKEASPAFMAPQLDSVYPLSATNLLKTSSDSSEIPTLPRYPSLCEPEANVIVPISSDASTRGIHMVMVLSVMSGQ